MTQLAVDAARFENTAITVLKKHLDKETHVENPRYTENDTEGTQTGRR